MGPILRTLVAIPALALAMSMSLPALADDLAVLSRVEPEFPHEAAAIGADEGHVRARLTIDGTGEVTRVEVLKAQPRRVFDRAAVRALAQWRFNSGASDRSYEVDIDFKR